MIGRCYFYCCFRGHCYRYCYYSCYTAGSAAANSKINRTNPSFKNTGEEGENTSLKRSGEGEGEYLSKRTKYANFVAASDSNSGFYFVVECKVTEIAVGGVINLKIIFS